MSDQTFLLVEDEPGDVFLMKRALKRASISTPLNVVVHGKEAIEYLSGEGAFADRTKFPMPTVVFLDLKLPYVHGFEVLAWIKSQNEMKSLVVIVLTSSAEERDSKRAYQLGARSYLVKPPTAEALVAVLNSIKTMPKH